MTTSDDQSTLGLLDIYNLSNEFDSIFFEDRLNQTASALVKRQEDITQNLRSSYSSPPGFLDLFGGQHKNTTSTTAEELEVSSSVVSKAPCSTRDKGLDSKYFREDTFDPSSLRYSDSFNDEQSYVSISNSVTPKIVDKIKDEDEKILSTSNEWKANLDLQANDEADKILSTSDKLEGNLDLQSNDLAFLPEEIGARSTAVHDNDLFPGALNTSWNISGFSVDFSRKTDSGFSSSPMEDQFLSNEAGMQVILQDEKEFEAEHALEVSENHDFDNEAKDVNPFEITRAENSLTASKVFGHQSWMLGSGMDRPSFGMSIHSPVRPTDSILPNLTTVNIPDRSFALDSCNKSCSVPKQKPDRRGSMRRSSHMAGQVSVTSALPTTTKSQIAAVVSSHSVTESQATNSCRTSLSNSRSKRDDQECSSSSGSLPVSPVPFKAPSCHTPLMCQYPCSSQSSVYPSSSLVTPTPQLISSFNSDIQKQDVSRQMVISTQQHSHFSTVEICPSGLQTLTVCLGESVDTYIPIKNPFPDSLQCQIHLMGVFSNEQPLYHSRMSQTIAWNGSESIVLPNQKKDIPISFCARIPGQLCLAAELHWSTVEEQNGHHRTGKCSCLINCDVVLPKVTITAKNLKIKYHAFSNTAETKSFVLLNHTPAPVTVGLNILLSGVDEGVWSDGELFFAVNHLQQYSSNRKHQWLNTSSPSVLSVCLASGTSDVPSQAEIPVSFRSGQPRCQLQNNQANDFGATVIVSQQALQPARSLTALRISVISSPVPLGSSHCSDSVSRSGSVSSAKEMPVIKSKKNVYFLATDIGGCRKEDLILKNCGPSCTLTAYIEQEESSAFQLCYEDSQSANKEWTLKKKESLALTVAFRPTTKAVYQAVLHISGATSESKASCKIMLHGCGGCCKLSIHSSSINGEAVQRELKRLRFTKGIGEEKQLLILNKGVRPAFVSVAQPSGDATVFSTKFIVLPYSQKVLTVVCCNRNLNESLLIFYGEEHFRQSISKRLPSLKKPGLYNKFDPTGNFKDQEQVPTESLYNLKDINSLGELFYKHLSHFEVHLSYSAAESLDNTSLSQFEETVSSE